MLGLKLPETSLRSQRHDSADGAWLRASAAVKLVLNILDVWQIPLEQRSSVLGTTSAALKRYAQGRFPERPSELRRVEDLLAIYKALVVLLPETDEIRADWINRRNRAFANRSPADVMQTDGTTDVHRHLEGYLYS